MTTTLCGKCKNNKADFVIRDRKRRISYFVCSDCYNKLPKKYKENTHLFL